MSVLINDMAMPKEPDEWIEIAIFGDGKVIQTGESWRNIENGKCYYATTTPEKFFNAVPVPPHGRLINADAMIKDMEGALWDWETVDGIAASAVLKQTITDLRNAPTIIPAEECE